MRILHFSDTHLGYSDGAGLDTDTGMNLREKDVYNTFNQVLDAIEEIKPDMVIHSGDLFDNYRPSNRAISIALRGIKRISDLGIPLVIISGNHSTPRISATGCIFESFESLFKNVFAVYGGNHKEIKINDASVFCISHMPDEISMKDIFEKITPNPKSKINILVAHIGISGDKDFKMGEFNEQIIPQKSLIKKKDFDYIALGHYHKHIKILDNCYYSGSTERFSLDDIGQEKGFILIDIGKPIKFMPLKTREIMILEPIDCKNRTIEEVMNKIKEFSSVVTGKIIKLTLINISKQKYVNLDHNKIKEYTAKAASLNLSYELINEEGKKMSSTSIGNLMAEFESFLESQKSISLDKNKLKKIGSDYLSSLVEGDEI